MWTRTRDPSPGQGFWRRLRPLPVPVVVEDSCRRRGGVPEVRRVLDRLRVDGTCDRKKVGEETVKTTCWTDIRLGKRGFWLTGYRDPRGGQGRTVRRSDNKVIDRRDQGWSETREHVPGVVPHVTPVV